MATCNKCQQPIEWLTTAKGKNMPIDPTPVPVTIDGKGVVKAYRSHFATCPANQQNQNGQFPPPYNPVQPPPKQDEDLPF